MNVEIRPAVPSDAEACGRIMYEAFKGITDRHGFPPHFATVEVAIQRANFCIDHPSIFGVVAETDGQVIGSNFLDERNPIRGLGPVTVNPQVQVRGIGRRLMEAVLERARGAVGVRLVQDSFNMLSISLYASFGFEVKEPHLLMRGQPKDKPRPGVEVRSMRKEDLGQCAALCGKVHGIERLNELQDGLKTLSPLAAWRKGQIIAYALALHVWPRNHAVAQTEEDMKALSGCEHEYGTAVITFAGAASKFVSLVFRPGVPSRPADDADGDGQISGSQWLPHPIDTLLKR